MDFLNYLKEHENRINKNDLNIILLAHVLEPRGYKNKEQLQCSDTERFSIDEFNEIYQGIVNAGYYIQSVYFNEIDFINEYLMHPDRFSNCLIYNLFRNGAGYNKKTVIPAFCELVGLRYSTSSSLACAVCRNKYYFSILLQKHNIPVPRSWFLLSDGNWLSDSPQTGTKVICKPASESASQGINNSHIFYSDYDSYKLLKGNEYIVQEFIDGKECEVPVIKISNDIIVFPPVGIDLHTHQIMDEECSTNYDYGFYSIQNVLSPQTINIITKYAKEAFLVLKMEVYGRIDFRIDIYGNPYIFDISTTPYTTSHSSFSYSFIEESLGYSDIYNAIIIASLYRNIYT